MPSFMRSFTSWSAAAVFCGGFVLSPPAVAENTQSKVAQLKLSEQPSPRARGVKQAKPWLGVAIDEHKEGVLIKDALTDTPAQKAGLKGGDVITMINDISVKSPKELISTIQAQGVGNEIDVHFLRDGKKQTLKVELVSRPDEVAMLQSRHVDKPAPKFALPVAFGEDSGQMDEYKGKVIFLEFWATWCPACRQTHPRLTEMAKKWRDRGFRVIGVSDEDSATQQHYAKKSKVGFTLLTDLENKYASQWMIPAIPTLVVIDQEGVVRYAGVGAGRYVEEALKVADQLLSK